MDERSKILIVDDERQNIKILTEFLRVEYKIMAAKDGETAMKALAAPVLPDLILLDIILPGMSGFEIIQHIKSDQRTSNIPVIFITALDAADDESLGFEMGAVDYITKPFKPVVVKARVKTHIQLKQKTDMLSHLASFDGLTQIPNRRSFDSTLEKEMKKATRNGSMLSLLLIDIDYFKNFNDTYGHTAGDDCLQKVAGALAKVAARPGDSTARYGGEEFAIILPETDQEGAVHIARQVQMSVARLSIPHRSSQVSDCVSISIGVATNTTKELMEPVEFIAQADAALYQAKKNGRNCVVAASKVNYPNFDLIPRT